MERKIEFARGEKELRIEGGAECHPPVKLSSSSLRISDLAAAAQSHVGRAPIPVSGQIYFHYRGEESGPLKSWAAIRSATILSPVTCQLRLPGRGIGKYTRKGGIPWPELTVPSRHRGTRGTLLHCRRRSRKRDSCTVKGGEERRNGVGECFERD